MKPSFALLLLLLATVSVARAENCTNATTQTAMNLCADQAYKKSDAELNHVYQQIMRQLRSNQDSTRLLVTAQKSWLAFRDTECAFASSGSAGGSVHPMIVTQCRDDLTSQRIKQLKTFLHCQEGDLGCPAPSS